MQSVTEFFKEENDFLYRKGFKKRFESTEHGRWTVNVITNLIAQSDLLDEQIAGIANVPVSFVESVRAGLMK